MIESKKAPYPTRKAFAERMVEYGEIDKEFTVLEADIGCSTQSMLFGEKYPARYFNMGIAELGMVSAAAGMAADGHSVIASSYGIFLTTRAVEAIRSFICYPNLKVKFLASHGGLTAAIDGVTHQATEDIAYMSTLPNMHVLVPADTNSARKMFDLSMQIIGPCYVRLFRDAYYELYGADQEFEVGGSKLVREGRDVTIAAYGDMVFQALRAADILKDEGIDAEVIDLYSVKPLDYNGLRRSAEKTGCLFVVENHQARNGVGYEISDFLMKNSIYIPYTHIGIEDTFAESGLYEEIIHKYGIDCDAIVDGVRKLINVRVTVKE